MNFVEFRAKMYPLICFNINQLFVVFPSFSRNNLVRWTKKGYLVKLRQAYYTFAEYNAKPGYLLYFAGRIYKPSYISLHTALAFYGIIPEAVGCITSVSSLKTTSFINRFGTYVYKSLSNDLMFGYVLKEAAEGKTFSIALPEKALADLLYLYPFYKSPEDMQNLRLDEDFLNNDFKKDLFNEYILKFNNKALVQRASTLLNTYNL